MSVINISLENGKFFKNGPELIPKHTFNIVVVQRFEVGRELVGDEGGAMVNAMDSSEGRPRGFHIANITDEAVHRKSLLSL